MLGRKFDEQGIVMEMPAHRLTWAEINLDNAVLNLNSIKKRVGPGARIIGVINSPGERPG